MGEWLNLERRFGDHLPSFLPAGFECNCWRDDQKGERALTGFWEDDPDAVPVDVLERYTRVVGGLARPRRGD